MVHPRGFEPPRPCEHKNLNLACLPVPPRVRAKQVVDVLHAGHGVNMQMVLIPVCQAWGTLVWWRTMKSSDIKVTLRGLVPTPTGCGVFLVGFHK